LDIPHVTGLMAAWISARISLTGFYVLVQPGTFISCCAAFEVTQPSERYNTGRRTRMLVR